MELYGFSKSKIISLEKSGNMKPYNTDKFKRKIFYDIDEIEKIFINKYTIYYVLFKHFFQRLIRILIYKICLVVNCSCYGCMPIKFL